MKWLGEFDQDVETGAVYVRLMLGDIDHTIEVTPHMNVDVDSEGNPIGLEWLP